MSRQPRAGKVTIRATDAERDRWEAAAIRQRISLSNMLREQANATASQMEIHAPPGAWDAALREARKKRAKPSKRSKR